MKNLAGPFFSLILLAAAISLYAYLGMRIAGHISAISDAKESVRLLAVRDQTIRGMSGFVADTAPERAELESFAIKSSDTLRIIKAVESAAAQEGIQATIGSITVVPGEGKYHETVRVVVSGRGAFSALAGFATALEGLPFASRLETASLQASENRSWFGTFAVDFVKEKPLTP